MTWKDWRSGLRAIAAWFSTRRLERTICGIRRSACGWLPRLPCKRRRWPLLDRLHCTARARHRVHRPPLPMTGCLRIGLARLCVADELLRGGRAGVALRICALECVVDLVDVVGEMLSLLDQLLRAGDGPLDGLQRGVRQARQVPCLVEKHLRLVLQAGDLVVDLLQGASGLEGVLDVVRRVIDEHLPAGRGRCERQRDQGSADQRCAAEAMKRHGVISKEDRTGSCGRSCLGTSKSAAQSSPLWRSQAAAKASRPCSASIVAIAA
jgi:hypothetical protein